MAETDLAAEEPHKFPWTWVVVGIAFLLALSKIPNLPSLEYVGRRILGLEFVVRQGSVETHYFLRKKN